MVVLSVVVPAYNIAPLVGQVLSSLLLKELEDDIEVLFVDDGSCDDTLAAAKAYAKKHKNLRVFSKENGGHGSVINFGIEHARGRFFKVVDGDDYVEKKGFISLVRSLKSCRADMVINPNYAVDLRSGRRKKKYTPKLFPGHIYRYDGVCEKLGRIQVHNITHRTSVLKKNRIRVSEHCYYDDFEYTLYPIPYIRTVVYYNETVYDYVVGQASQSVSSKKAYENIPMLIRIFRRSVLYTRRQTELEDTKKQVMDVWLLSLLNNICNVYLRNAFEKGVYEDFKRFLRYIRHRYSSIYTQALKRYPHLKMALYGRVFFYEAAVLFGLNKSIKG